MRRGVAVPILALVLSPVAISADESELHRCLTVLARVGDQGPEIVDAAVSTTHDAAIHHEDCAETTGEGGGPAVRLLRSDGSEIRRVPIANGEPHVDLVDIAGKKRRRSTGLRRGEPFHDDLRVVSISLPKGATHVSHTGGGDPLAIRHGHLEECPPCVQEPQILTPDVEGGLRHVLDIVILGDGFRSDQQDKFVTLAKYLTESLLETPPFSRHRDKIRVHMIPTVSKEAGVDDWKDGAVRDTCLGLTGGKGGCCGTNSPKELFHALGCRFPIDEVDLRVVIANVPVRGGRGLKEIRVAYINANTDQNREKFAQVGIHEMAHALAGLADEYMGCDPEEGKKPSWPNVVSKVEADLGLIPWEKLWRERATKEELEKGMFRYDVPKGAFKTCPATYKIPKIHPSLDGVLGLFWGAMYVEGSSSCDCAPWGDPRGGHYYRPMAHCKMRDTKRDFCIVCEMELEKAILRRIKLKNHREIPPDTPKALRRTDTR